MLFCNKQHVHSDNEPDEMTATKLFEAQRDLIKSRRKEFGWGSDRMDPQNNKFTINITANDLTDTTLTDALFEDLKVSDQALERIHTNLNREDFDSDAMELDLSDTTNSNLCNFIDNQAVTEYMRTFIDTINCMYFI